MKVGIIGSGPSGLASAIVMGRRGINVTIYEKNKQIGKKLLLTGNGRCNYGNNNQDILHYHSNNEDLIPEIINEDNLQKLQDFYNSIGIVSKERNGYLYPFSEKASSIVSALKSEIDNLKVNIIYDKEITTIKKENAGFMVDDIYYDKVIVATGGASYPKTGSTGLGYQISVNFGHEVMPINPALMPLITSTGLENAWAGKRCEVDVSFYKENGLIEMEHGELQFTKTGLSGICIFNLSREIRLALNENKECSVHINFLPFLNEDGQMFLEKRANRLKGRNITELCDAFLDYELVYIILKSLAINPNKTWYDLTNNEKDKLSKTLTDFIVPIIDTKDFLDAQCTSGGISLKEIDLKTMESKKVKGLYFTGEVLDLDGDCGGYNLTIAFLTGLLAGEA